MKQFIYLFLASFLAFTLAAQVYAQEADVSVEFTARGQAYWVVTVNGDPVTQHSTEREAYESAANQIFIDPDAAVQITHDAIIDVEAFVDYVPLEEPLPDPDPIPPAPGTIEIPGVPDWIPVPAVTHHFRVLNDDYAVASDNQWLYVFKIYDSEVTDAWVVNRPNGWYRNEPIQSETTPLEVSQVIDLIAAISD